MLISFDHLEQLVSANEKYKKNIVDRLADLVLCGNAYSHPNYAAFFGGFHLDRKRLSLFF
jgi:hypothetical protein